MRPKRGRPWDFWSHQRTETSLKALYFVHKNTASFAEILREGRKLKCFSALTNAKFENSQRQRGIHFSGSACHKPQIWKIVFFFFRGFGQWSLFCGPPLFLRAACPNFTLRQFFLWIFVLNAVFCVPVPRPKLPLNRPKFPLNGPKFPLNWPKFPLNGPKFPLNGPNFRLTGPNFRLTAPISA